MSPMLDDDAYLKETMKIPLTTRSSKNLKSSIL